MSSVNVNSKCLWKYVHNEWYKGKYNGSLLHCMQWQTILTHWKGCGQWYTTLRGIRTSQEFIIPFEAKPRRYLEFETCSTPSKCGCHCTHSLRWAYLCLSLYAIQHKTFSQFLQCGQKLSTLLVVRTTIVLTAIGVDYTLKMWKTFF